MKASRLQEMERKNGQAAKIILLEPERYAGLPVEWARLWNEKHARPTRLRGTKGTATRRADSVSSEWLPFQSVR